MKNKEKFLGIIVLLITVGLLLTGCTDADTDKGPAFIKIINQNDNPVITVRTGSHPAIITNYPSVGIWENLNITKGNSETFTTIDIVDGILDTLVTVTIGGTFSLRIFPVTLRSGETITITIN